jgi:UDP-N-acetylglucosamine/UDP-N-acetylgalactosamine diphosphorylase
MSLDAATDDLYRRLRPRLEPGGQEHVLRWWPELSPAQREQLASQVEAVDLERLVAPAPPGAGPGWSADAVRPPRVTRLAASPADRRRDREAAARGEGALRAGQVAVVLVAGGQGTRLGHDGPKGTYRIGPVSGKSLFQVHAEKVLALGRRYGAPLPFYVMTSPDNDAVTRDFFAAQGFFGLDPDRVVFFQQGTMPALDRHTGKLLLADKGTLATSPNGHGGVLQALVDGGHLADLAGRGVHHLFYYQVDNPLVKVADPTYLGHHIGAGAEMSLKVVPKLTAGEKLGVVVEVDGRPRVIEYSDLPADLAGRRTAAGGLELWAGSIAVHVFDVAFLGRLAGAGALLPYHRALTKVPCLDDAGRPVWPAEPNAVKFEMFVFDALPLARTALVVETSRREEFEPLKNAAGENSPATVRQALSDLYADWLNGAGIEVVRRPDGSAAVAVEIGPLLALDAEELRARPPRTGPVACPVVLDVAPRRLGARG